MTDELDMVEESNQDHAEVYDPSNNKEDWGFSDLEGTSAEQKAETNDLHPAIFVKQGAKTIEIYHEKFGTLWGARYVEGGQLPGALTGKWTNADDAKLAVDIYVAQQQD